jgi:hypothetical protein
VRCTGAGAAVRGGVVVRWVVGGLVAAAVGTGTAEVAGTACLVVARAVFGRRTTVARGPRDFAVVDGGGSDGGDVSGTDTTVGSEVGADAEVPAG